MNAKELLKDAKALIATPDKWIKGKWRNNMYSPTAFCAVGALQQAFAATTTANVNYENLLDGGVVDDSYESLRNAYRDRPEEYNAYGSAYSALVAHTPASMPFITRYNDAPERTHKEILALYDAAIASLP